MTLGPKQLFEMVSRRKILSQSRDELNFRAPHEEEDDTWYNKEKLFKVNIGRFNDLNVDSKYHFACVKVYKSCGLIPI